MEMKINSNNTCLVNSTKENEQLEAVDTLVWVIWAAWDNLAILTQISLLAKCNSNLFQLLGRTKEAINTYMVLQVTPRTIIMGCISNPSPSLLDQNTNILDMSGNFGSVFGNEF